MVWGRCRGRWRGCRAQERLLLQLLLLRLELRRLLGGVPLLVARARGRGGRHVFQWRRGRGGGGSLLLLLLGQSVLLQALLVDHVPLQLELELLLVLLDPPALLGSLLLLGRWLWLGIGPLRPRGWRRRNVFRNRRRCRRRRRQRGCRCR